MTKMPLVHIYLAKTGSDPSYLRGGADTLSRPARSVAPQRLDLQRTEDDVGLMAESNATEGRRRRGWSHLPRRTASGGRGGARGGQRGNGVVAR